MSAPVWVLSVDLQTKTATFISGLGGAAHAARGSFNDIKAGAAEMGGAVGGSMGEARHTVMMLGEEFGIHLPRGLTTFIAGLGPIGPAMSLAFPFAAITLGATLLIEHLNKVKEAAIKLTEDQERFGTAAQNVFNHLDDQILQAGIRADELSGNHLGALKKQLQLIDHQSMSELVRSFGEIAKAADVVFDDLKTHLYQFGEGSEGAKHALTGFQAEYEKLIAEGKKQDAGELLLGTLEKAQRISTLQGLAKQTVNPVDGSSLDEQDAKYKKIVAAKDALAQEGVKYDEKAIAAQQTLVSALQDQVGVQERINALEKIQQENAVNASDTKVNSESGKAAFEQMKAEVRATEEAEKLQDAAQRQAVADLQEAERLKIDATEKGSAARLAAIDAAIKEENAKGLQETGFYRDLLNTRVALVRQMADEQAKLQADAAKEAADHTLKMGELELAAEKETNQSKIAQLTESGRERLNLELSIQNREYELQRTALQQQIAALDTFNKDYENRKKALNDKLQELDKENANKELQIQQQFENQQASLVSASAQRVLDEYAKGFTQVLTRKESFAKMMEGVDSQLLGSMMNTAIQSMLTLDLGKEKEAGEAARRAYVSAMQGLPAPANMIAAPAFAAAAFAGVMAYANEGMLVPGVERGDVVPAMLTPGETVIPRALTEQLQYAAQFGSGESRPHVHIHVHQSNTVHALDSEGMERVLNKHAETLNTHLRGQLRKLGH